VTFALSLAPLFAASRDSTVWRDAHADVVADPVATEIERAMIQRVGEGDPDAFRTLMEAHFPHAVRFAKSLLHDTEIAEDVAQDVFVKIWDARTTWMPSVSVRAYVLGAVRNRALNVIRHRHVEADYRTHVTVEPDRSSNTLDRLSHDADVAALDLAIAELPERRRMAITLRYRHELSHAEVGAALGVSAKAAKELIARTLEALYSRLRERAR
jgi:RNA polymerase sigma-70 factor (ECF subfamily)